MKNSVFNKLNTTLISKPLTSFILPFLLCVHLNAQPSFTQKDTSFILQKTLSNGLVPGFKPFIVPTAMVTYGGLALFVAPLKNLNHSIQHQIVTNHPDFSTHVDDYLWLVPTAAVYGLNIAGVKGQHNFRDLTLIVLMANGIMETGTFITKKAIHEERPDGSNAESFPSGHTASAFAAAEYLYQEYKYVSPWIGYGGYAVAAATGVLRLYNNQHYLGDVIAGAGVGIISTKLAYTFYPYVSKLIFGKSSSKTTALPGLNNGRPSFTFVHHFN